MSDFSDRPFVAGTVVGLRAFKIDTLGRLRGPQYPQIFKPGENLAECRKGEISAWGFPGMVSISGSGAGSWVQSGNNTLTFTPVTSGDFPKVEPKKHQTSGKDCLCGFYAYFDGSNAYKNSTTVSAIVEGYGVVTYGSRGFRAEKARLVALIEPKKKAVPNRDAAELLKRNYPDVPLYATKALALAAHPLSAHLAGTPDDDDFWTRSA